MEPVRGQEREDAARRDQVPSQRRRVQELPVCASACLTLTEVNPDHDPTGELTRQLVSGWSAAIAGGLPH